MESAAPRWGSRLAISLAVLAAAAVTLLLSTTDWGFGHPNLREASLALMLALLAVQQLILAQLPLILRYSLAAALLVVAALNLSVAIR